MNSIINNLTYFFNRIFIKKTKYPIISIILFIIIIILNSIQYANNENYLQEKLKISNRNYDNGTVNIGNLLLVIYNVIGINGFINNITAFIFVFILTYFCLALIELNIGHLPLLFLLYIDIIFFTYWGPFTKIICKNESQSFNVGDFYSGSVFLSIMTLGFILFLIQKNIINIYYRMILIFIMVCIWITCILIDKYFEFEYNKTWKTSHRTCKSLIYHSSAFLFGIFSGSVLGK